MNNVLVYLIKSTPPVTRILCAIICLIFIATSMNYAYGSSFMFSKYHFINIVMQKNFSEIYRVFVFPYYFGKPNVENYLHMLFFYRYSTMLEESYMYKSDYIYILFWCHVLMVVSSMLVYNPNMGPTLACILTYLWTRKNPRSIVQAYGFVTFPAFYIPFIMPMFTFLANRTINIEELLGIICGHIVYFLRECYPKFGYNILKTPCFLHIMFNEKQSCCIDNTQITEAKKIEKLHDISRIHNMIQKKLQESKEYFNNEIKKKDSQIICTKASIESDYESADFTEKTKDTPNMSKHSVENYYSPNLMLNVQNPESNIEIIETVSTDITIEKTNNFIMDTHNSHPDDTIINAIQDVEVNVNINNDINVKKNLILSSSSESLQELEPDDIDVSQNKPQTIFSQSQLKMLIEGSLNKINELKNAIIPDEKEENKDENDLFEEWEDVDIENKQISNDELLIKKNNFLSSDDQEKQMSVSKESNNNEEVSSEEWAIN